MTDHLLTRPVFVRIAAGLVQEIASLGDAIEFLDDWSHRDRDLIHETAMRTLIAVHDGQKPLAAAQSAIEGFARAKHILEGPEEMMANVAAADKNSPSYPAQ